MLSLSQCSSFALGQWKKRAERVYVSKEGGVLRPRQKQGGHQTCFLFLLDAWPTHIFQEVEQGQVTELWAAKHGQQVAISSMLGSSQSLFSLLVSWGPWRKHTTG